MQNSILTTDQIRAWDAYTIAHTPISSLDLMENASLAFVGKFMELYPTSVGKIIVLCGLGNNGGDGLAIARLLQARQYDVEVWVARCMRRETADFQVNLARLGGLPIRVHTLHSMADLPTSAADLFIDALFGSGLSTPLAGFAGELVGWLNAQNAPIVSVDIASGLFADLPTEGEAVHPVHTICFEVPKLAFLLPQNAPFVGEWHAVSIGLLPSYLDTIETPLRLVTADLVGKLLRPRPKFGHKGTFGHALIIGGSYGKMGAVVLATRACLRSGAGLTTAYIPRVGYQILQISVPEAMTLTDESENVLAHAPDTHSFGAVGVGVGIGKAEETKNMLAELFSENKQSIVLDADALNILAENPPLLAGLPAHAVLTPHPKEFERLTCPAKDHFERLTLLRDFAQQKKAFVILKGAHSALATPAGEVFFNTTGNAGMATGGSGDVLTGIITGFLAQGYAPFEAALLGMYLHGLAGDIAIENSAPHALIASDLVENLGKAIKRCASAKS